MYTMACTVQTTMTSSSIVCLNVSDVMFVLVHVILRDVIVEQAEFGIQGLAASYSQKSKHPVKQECPRNPGFEDLGESGLWLLRREGLSEEAPPDQVCERARGLRQRQRYARPELT